MKSDIALSTYEIVHEIVLSPFPHPIRFDINSLNTVFIKTATTTTGNNRIDSPDDLYQFINDISSDYTTKVL